jgi:glutamate racemase
MNAPIGIFDSGIGGLTVANAISGVLPNEQLIYFGDTAHLPYGDKSKELIKHYSERITDYLVKEKGCKAIVIACNTASSAAYEYLRDKYRGVVPIISVIDPIIEAIVEDDSIHRVGLIATKATIASGVYQEKLQRRKPDISYAPLATPLLVPMIEEGFHNNNISHALIHNYLENEALRNIDALVLGCTHYIIVRKEIDAFYGGKVKLFDSTSIVANKLRKILQKEGLLSLERKRNDEFLVSDYTEAFAKTARMFYGHEIKLVLKDIWKD